MAVPTKKKTSTKSPAVAKKSPSPKKTKASTKAAPAKKVLTKASSPVIKTPPVAPAPVTPPPVPTPVTPPVTPTPVSVPKVTPTPISVSNPVASPTPPKTSMPSMSTEKKIPDSEGNMFTVLLALLVVAVVVLGGYLYAHRTDEVSALPAAPEVSHGGNINVASTVTLSPEVVSALDTLVTIAAIGANDILQNVGVITDIMTVQKQSPDFFARAQNGDMILQFTDFYVLYRPTTKQVVSIGKMTPVATTTTAQ